MNKQEVISNLIPPGQQRAGKQQGGVIQIWVTRACDKSCFGCTQGGNLRGYTPPITPEQFEQACISLKDYFGVVGIFGGNPTTHPQFNTLCEILCKHIPYKRRGLWCNNLRDKGEAARKTFNPAASNLNVHLDHKAFNGFQQDWPESRPFGLLNDSRHSPPFVALQDIIPNEKEQWSLIADCDINRNWSAMIGVFREELRGYFCEIAGAQAMLHQNEPEYPDLGLLIDPEWWKRPMADFAKQSAFHCPACGVPLRGYGELAQAKDGREQVSRTHAEIYQPKTSGRKVQLVTCRNEMDEQSLSKFTDYLGNGEK